MRLKYGTQVDQSGSDFKNGDALAVREKSSKLEDHPVQKSRPWVASQLESDLMLDTAAL